MSRDFCREILERLVKKYEAGQTRIALKPTEIYKDYDKYNADIRIKQDFDEAAAELSSEGLVKPEKIKYGSDIRRITLVVEAVEDSISYLKDKYGIVPRGELINDVNTLLEEYNNSGKLCRDYINEITDSFDRSHVKPDVAFCKNVLKMLAFLENNKSRLYIREASMLVYGDSKLFEESTLKEVCRVVGQSDGEYSSGEETDVMPLWMDYDTEDISVLIRYGIYPGEQEIRIKGEWRIGFSKGDVSACGHFHEECGSKDTCSEEFAGADDYGETELDVSGITGGISISTACFDDISFINTGDRVMTVENKTSFERMQEDGHTSYMYLGGFCNRGQARFVKYVYRDNPGAEYLHFGDIDAGGLFIHRNLCEVTGVSFSMYKMGVEQLSDTRYAKCLKKLTENDKNRLEGLKGDKRYTDIVSYMEKNDCKLEQEIVSLSL